MNRSSIRHAAFLAFALGIFACGGEPTASADEAGLDRETFIATYVDLRVAVGRQGTHELTDAERTRILADHSVTEAELLDFVEIHGTDVAFMRDVWDEVEARMDGVRLAPGTPDTR
jgi:hypothetical protein